MKASLFAEDEDEDDQDQGLMKSTVEAASGRRLVPRVQTRPSGTQLCSTTPPVAQEVERVDC